MRMVFAGRERKIEKENGFFQRERERERWEWGE